MVDLLLTEARWRELGGARGCQFRIRDDAFTATQATPDGPFQRVKAKRVADATVESLPALSLADIVDYDMDPD